MLFANVCARFFFSGTEIVGIGSFGLFFWFFLGTLCIFGVLVLLVIPLVCTKCGFQRCASYWTRPLGGGRWGIIFVTPGEFAGKHKKLPIKCGMGFVVFMFLSCKCYPLVGRPSLHSYDACMVYQGTGGILEKLQAKIW